MPATPTRADALSVQECFVLITNVRDDDVSELNQALVLMARDATVE